MKDVANLRKILLDLFQPSPKAPEILSKYHRLNELRRLAAQDNSTQSSPLSLYSSRKASSKLPDEGLKTKTAKSATNTLYFFNLGLRFRDSDFKRVYPTPEAQITSFKGMPNFSVFRSRNPINLTPWFGHFLVFNTPEEADIYRRETLGAELSGVAFKLRFVDPHLPSIEPSILSSVPSVNRRMCVLLLGMPEVSTWTIIRALSDYLLVDNDKLAVERLPKDKVKYGSYPILLRFQNEFEAERFALDFDRKCWPGTDQKVFAEVVD